MVHIRSSFILRTNLSYIFTNGIRYTSSIIPSVAYDLKVKSGELHEDAIQRKVVQVFDKLHLTVKHYKPPKQYKSIFSIFQPKNQIVEKGVYLYGGVGCGKTMLMDMFYTTCDITHKKRVHFHDFMSSVHAKIHEVRKAAPPRKPGPESQPFDPIPIVAESIAAKYFLLCFDEFQVTDIADAMILKRLFSELFNNGVIVLATSNRHPDDLYKNGLQRGNFIPFIKLLKERTEVLNIDSNIDYRRMTFLEDNKVYIRKNESSTADSQLQTMFDELCQLEQQEVKTQSVQVFGRTIEFRKACGGLVDCTFDELCKSARSAADYIAMCKKFHTLILRDIPYLGLHDRSSMRRFITLLDTLYDHKVRLICSAAAKPDDLFVKESNDILTDSQIAAKRMLLDDLNLKMDSEEGRNASIFTGEEELFAFDRTVSRLTEMQTKEYWEKCSQSQFKDKDSGIATYT